ncbi:MAG TPA: di-trans,poly-cis-decaprenylcistransferase [Methanosarcinaceae archaeon]|nr:di-trans,poly-cis-decaprenylcistransferase [Methanosarcinaceae archaeon]
MLKFIWRILYRVYERSLVQEVVNGTVPRHVAVIMDGNRRYAGRIKRATRFGHAKGADTTEKVIDWSWEAGVEHLTIYAFSTENFNRSEDETEALFDLIGLKFDEMCEDERTHTRRMRVRVIGDTSKVSLSLQRSIEKVEHTTRDYDGFHLNVAIAYGGRQDIVQAVQEIANKVQRGELELDEITESTISDHLYPAGGAAVPNVDLIIRTGGDMRVSNFLSWQANGNECAAYFCAPFWPEFRKIDLLRSIRVYQSRMRAHYQNNECRAEKFVNAVGKTEVDDVLKKSKRVIKERA